METKVRAAVALIREAVHKHRAPVVYSSFGKDSMVLLDLVKLAGFKFPVIFHRESTRGCESKYAFADRVVAAEGYEVHDWPPLAVHVVKRNGALEIVNRHQAGNSVGGKVPANYLPIGIRGVQPGKPWTCGLDFMSKPLADVVDFRWDLGIIGHKSTDVDPVLGPVPLKTNALPAREYGGTCSFIFPLADFTDEDVWAYTLARGLPINHGRYDQARAWVEHEDVTYNPDWFLACASCLDPDQPAHIPCPRLGGVLIANISQQVVVAPPQAPYVEVRS